MSFIRTINFVTKMFIKIYKNIKFENEHSSSKVLLFFKNFRKIKF